MLDKRLLSEGIKSKKFLLIMVANGLFTFAISLFVAYYISKIVSELFILQYKLNETFSNFIILTSLMLAKPVYTFIFDRYFRIKALKIKKKIREDLFSALLSNSPLNKTQGSTGENLTTVCESTDYLDNYFQDYLPQFFVLIISVPLILIPVFSIDLISFLIMILTAPLLPIFLALIGMASKKANQDRMEKLKKLGNVFFETLNGLKTLKLFGKSKNYKKKLFEDSEALRKSTMEVLRVSFLSAFVLELASTISTAIIAVSLGLRLMYGQIDFQNAFFILLLAPEYYQPIRQFGAKFHVALSSKTAAANIFPIIDNWKKDTSTKNLHTEFEVDEGISIKIDGLYFKYSNESHEVFNDFNYSLSPHTLNFLIGKSGTGKTTLASLLLGFLSPVKGTIYVNGIDIETLDKGALFKHFSYIPQRPYIFNTTLLENIKIGNPGATEKEVIEAIEKASLSSFLSSLPHGLETILREEGVDISIGEAQRISIARALLKKSSFIIIDEATSAQDDENLDALSFSFDSLKESATLLIITHRLECVRNYDTIINLDEKGITSFV